MRISNRMAMLLSLSIIFILFTLFRFYNLHHRIMFDWDQERDAWQIYELFKNFKPTLIGPRVVGPNGFFLPPYFIYILAPFYLMANLHPFGMLLFLGAYNIAFFFGGLWILNKLFQYKSAVLFMLFWTVNFLLARYDVISWNPVILPLCILGTWYLLSKIRENPSIKHLMILGAFMTLGLSMHFQYIFVMLQVFLFIFLLKPKFSKTNVKKGLLLFAAMLAPLLPLVVFDLRHGFLNSKLFVNFFFLKREIYYGATYTNWIEVWTNFLEPITYVKSIPASIIIYVLIAAASVYLAKKTKGFSKVFFTSSITVWLAMPIFFTIYKNRPSEYYFTFTYPYMFITVIEFFKQVGKEKLTFALVGILLLFNIKDIRYDIIDGIHTLYAKDQAVRTLKPYVENKKFNISYDVPLGRNNGFSYLLQYHGIPPSNVETDPLFQIRIPAIGEDIYVHEIGIMIPPEFKK